MAPSIAFDQKLSDISIDSKEYLTPIFLISFSDEFPIKVIVNIYLYIDEHMILSVYDIFYKSFFLIQLLVDKAFKDDWFNKALDLNLKGAQLVELLQLATTKQFRQFDGNLNEELDGVAMGSLLGQLMANSFMFCMKND